MTKVERGGCAITFCGSPAYVEFHVSGIGQIWRVCGLHGRIMYRQLLDLYGGRAIGTRRVDHGLQ